jgi:elongation factor Ts
MHIAASAPQYVSADDIPQETRDAKKQELLASDALNGKPADMADKIVDGQLQKYFAERCLLEQPFVKNPDVSVGEYVKEHGARLGENVVVRRFSRIALGEVA